MPAPRIGARELGLSINWRYVFVPPGSMLEPRTDAIALDVGGALCHGVLDQHQDGSLGACTSELLMRYPEHCYGHLLNPWLSRRDDGQDITGRVFSPAVILHEEPDFDCLVTSYLAKCLIETGEFPAYAHALVGYASRVDQGKYRVNLGETATATFPVHMGYLALQSRRGEPVPAQRFERNLRLGEAMLRTVIAALGEARNNCPWDIRASDFENVIATRAVVPSPDVAPQASRSSLPPCAAWRADPACQPEVQMLDADLALYLQDKDL